MGPSEQLTIDRGWIEWVLEAHPCGCSPTSAAAGAPVPASLFGYTVKQLTMMFDNGPSSIKSWCALGVFGAPTTLKPNGRDWHVPVDRVAELQRKLADGWKITSEGLLKPDKQARRALGKAERSGDASDSAVPPAANADRPAVRKRRKDKGRHNEWRQHVL